jgi:hypothetical protein
MMRELVLEWAITSPSASITFGRFLFYFGGTLGLLGLRLDRLGDKFERISSRAGVAMPDILAALPRWLRIVIPESAFGWIAVVVCLALGVYLVHLGKWAKKVYA